MIPITDRVSNAIAAYQERFHHRIRMNDIAAFDSPEEFVSRISRMIQENDPYFGCGADAGGTDGKDAD